MVQPWPVVLKIWELKFKGGNYFLNLLVLKVFENL
jgi:hypothetical protein